MNKLEFITRQFSRAESKRFEHYVVTRIWHLLNDIDIKFITQQYVVRPNGIALTDMYFPQLNAHVEIDEPHHLKQMEADKVREADIINATQHKVFRVDIAKGLESINSQIDKIVEELKILKTQISNFNPWDTEAELNPKTYIEKGEINLKDNTAFNTMVDAANCFGKTYKKNGIWSGGVKHPKELGKLIWFPKLYLNGTWNNSISNDENFIYEKHLSEDQAKKHIDITKTKPHRRIVFARVRSNLGDIMYRFKGEYALDLEKTNYETGLVWQRISEEVKTYSTD